MSAARGLSLFIVPVAAAAAIGLAVERLNLLPTRSTAAIDLSTAATEGWRETPWPFHRDQFGAGRAYATAELRLTLRAKIGFCDCAAGVSDDEELERIGDVSLVDASLKAGPPGREIRIGHMKGRSRAYGGSGADPLAVLSIAFNHRCDVMVATATGGDLQTREAEALVFLGSAPTLAWVEQALGL